MTLDYIAEEYRIRIFHILQHSTEGATIWLAFLTFEMQGDTCYFESIVFMHGRNSKGSGSLYFFLNNLFYRLFLECAGF